MKIAKDEKYIEIVTTRIDKLNLMPDRTLDLLHKTLGNYYSKVEISIISREKELRELVIKKPDIVISGIKYLGFNLDSIQRNSTNKIWFSDFLDEHNILYTGSSKKSIEFEFDKSKAKDIVSKYGCNTASFFVAKPNQYTQDDIPLDFPLFIKPLYEGDSRGIDFNSLVFNFKEYHRKVSAILENQGTVSLVEKYLNGKEYTVAIFQNLKNNTYQVYPIELLAEKNIEGERILGFTDKIADKESSLKIEDDNIKNRISKLALDSFKALGAKGYGRIDIKMDEKGIPCFLEANLIPGLGAGYLYRCYNLNTGLPYEQMILDIVRNAFEANTANR
ncbi:MAG: D-alanine--D-alanine ligase [Deltaproteobacteria bacterium]|nr:D-alanine--D-alanine ligase [Deltaproteobacteria bacterium]